jgi:predicted site-specific integrase-resolvase
MIDRKQLAARWNVSIPTLKRMEKRGLLDIVSLSERVLRYRLEDIERMEADVEGDVA